MNQSEPKKKHSAVDLDGLYNDAESCDSGMFAEMRSNLLLISGEHYARKDSQYYKRIRDSKELSEQQKLRLTKNHVQRIVKSYCNHILAQAPGVGFEAKNESELQDQKAAEIHHAIWQDSVDRNRLHERIDDWCDDFVGIGEVATKIFWDPDAGKVKPNAFHQKVGEDGQPAVDESGEMVADMERPARTGDFVYETLYGFNLLRPPECKDMEEAAYLILRKMVATKKLEARYGSDPVKKKFIVASSDETFVVFDSTKGGYRKTNNEVMIRETYFRPCAQYPNGYFYIATAEGILEEGPLPGGEFPIVFQAFEKVQTTPRGRGPVKTMRPYQAEINRSASKIAEHQVTLGDDKLLVQNGTKTTAGVALPGVRSINYTGMEPKVLNGRDGSQYLNYMLAQIKELYQVMGVPDDLEPAATGQLDAYALLFRAASQKQKFNRNIARFERFLVNVAKLHSRLAKIFLPDDCVVYAAGRKERVNIPEFRAMEDVGYQIKLVPQADDVETKMGKQLVLNHLVQYTGTKLDKEDIGKLVRLMPYANMEEGMNDLTLDYDLATNDILALDRGELPPVNEYDNHVYLVKRLVSRTRQADFSQLAPAIQQNYHQLITQHQQAQAIVIAKMQQAQAGFIPTGGYLVVVDLYVSDPQNPKKTQRARLPYEAVVWLLKKLEAQGQTQEQLAAMNQGAMAQMSDMLLAKTQGQLPGPMGAGSAPPMTPGGFGQTAPAPA